MVSLLDRVIVMSVSPPNSGTIFTNGNNVSNITVQSGDIVTWQATAAAGFKFDHFISAQGATTSQNPVSFKITMDGTMTAVFVPISAAGWNVALQRNGQQLNVIACAGNVKGYFNFLTPNHQTRYATYVDPGQCTNFDLPISDMIASGGEGLWTAVIYDVNDMTQGKAYMQYIIQAASGITHHVTSVPSGASVKVNGNQAGVTPFDFLPGWITDLTFEFSLAGYETETISGRYTISSTINANLSQKNWECQAGTCKQTTAGTMTKMQCDASCSVINPTLSLSVDKNQFNTGDTITFKVASDKPDGTIINLYESMPLGDTKVGTGVLAGGKCTISKKAGVNGTIPYYVCTPGLVFACGDQSNIVTIVIGKQNATDWITWAIILGILTVLFFYSKELGVFKAIKKRK